MLTIAGWSVVEIVPQETTPTRGGDELLSVLGASRMAFSKDDLIPPGYYAIARNGR